MKEPECAIKCNEKLGRTQLMRLQRRNLWVAEHGGCDHIPRAQRRDAESGTGISVALDLIECRVAGGEHPDVLDYWNTSTQARTRSPCAQRPQRERCSKRAAPKASITPPLPRRQPFHDAGSQEAEDAPLLALPHRQPFHDAGSQEAEDAPLLALLRLRPRKHGHLPAAAENAHLASSAAVRAAGAAARPRP